MYPDIPLVLAMAFLAFGLYALTWSADRFVEGAGDIARSFGISPFIVGVVVIGFGTSAPELAVSAVSGMGGHAELALGNAYGSNIFNIAVILGVAALIRPLAVRPVVVYAAVPLLILISLLSFLLTRLGDGFSRTDGFLSLAAFSLLLPFYCWVDQKSKRKEETPDTTAGMHAKHPFVVVIAALTILVGSSHVLVWGAVDLARTLGISELVIGLTIVAAGTSLPELASAIASARQDQHEFVLGNIIGSNFFNTLAVVGLSGAISPFGKVSPYVLTRDLPAMLLLSASIGAFGFNLRSPRSSGRIGRIKAIAWLLAFGLYLAILFKQES